MTQALLPVLSQPVHAVVTVPGSKSISNRALLMAALARGASKLDGLLLSDDTKACLAALSELGVSFQITAETICFNADTNLCKTGSIRDKLIFNCHDAGTVTRFLIPICAALSGRYHFYASARMMERPLAPLLQVLAAQGAAFKFLQQPMAMPFDMEAEGLLGGEVELNLSESSQFLSGLMLAAPLAAKPFVFSAKNLAEKPYIAMTASMMQRFGVGVNYLDADRLMVLPGVYQGINYQIEPDASTASYFFAAAALSGGRVQVRNLHLNSLQGDIKFLQVLARMGCQVVDEAEGISVQGPKQLQAVPELDMTGFSDTFMTVAMLAPFTEQAMTLTGLRHTRLQESDRVAAVAEGLMRLGIRVETTADSLRIHPGKISGANIDSYRDHRIAMSFALLGLKAPKVIIEGAECVSKTCPNYFELMQSMVQA